MQETKNNLQIFLSLFYVRTHVKLFYGHLDYIVHTNVILSLKQRTLNKACLLFKYIIARKNPFAPLKQQQPEKQQQRKHIYVIIKPPFGKLL